MGIRNQKLEALGRIECKTLEAQFLTEIQQGLNCSPFEATAVLDVVREVFLPDLSTSDSTPMPGRVTLLVVCAEEPSGKPLVQCQKVSVCLTVHRGPEDDRISCDPGEPSTAE